jgi:hypothetical protein
MNTALCPPCMTIEMHVAHADGFLEESTTARMQSSLCLRVNNTVGEDCANVIHNMLRMCSLSFALEPLACKCVPRGVLGWRWGCHPRDPSPQHNGRTEAILPSHTAHLDMLYDIRPLKDRAFLHHQIVRSGKHCLSVCNMLAVARLCVASLVRPASRHGAGGLRLLLWLLEMQHAPTIRMPIFPTINFATVT